MVRRRFEVLALGLCSVLTLAACGTNGSPGAAPPAPTYPTYRGTWTANSDYTWGGIAAGVHVTWSGSGNFVVNWANGPDTSNATFHVSVSGPLSGVCFSHAAAGDFSSPLGSGPGGEGNPADRNATPALVRIAWDWVEV